MFFPYKAINMLNIYLLNQASADVVPVAEVNQLPLCAMDNTLFCTMYQDNVCIPRPAPVAENNCVLSVL